MKISLDTNVFLAVKNKEPDFDYCKKIIDSIEENKIEGAVSTIVVAEVLVGFYQNREIDKAKRFSGKILLNYEIHIVGLEIAQEAAKIRAKHNIKLPDAIIAASTLASGADFFISQDKKLLKRLDIQIIAPKEFVKKYLESSDDLKEEDN